jgi:hypothetical protein
VLDGETDLMNQRATNLTKEIRLVIMSGAGLKPVGMGLHPKETQHQRECQEEAEPRKDQTEIVERLRTAFGSGEVPIGSQFLKHAPEEQPGGQPSTMAIESRTNHDPMDQEVPHQTRTKENYQTEEISVFRYQSGHD